MGGMMTPWRRDDVAAGATAPPLHLPFRCLKQRHVHPTALQTGPHRMQLFLVSSS